MKIVQKITSLWMRNDFITKPEKLFIIMQFYHFKDTDSRILLY